MIRQLWDDYAQGNAPSWLEWLGGVALAFLFVALFTFVGILDMPGVEGFGP